MKYKDTAIVYALEVKYLGIEIDKTLSGEGILVTVVKKCNGRIKFLYRQAWCLPKAVKRTLYQPPVQCHLDYGASSWYAAMTQKAKRKLQIVQNKMVSFILDLAPRTHLTVDHMKELNLIRDSDRAKQLRVNNAHKIFYNQVSQMTWKIVRTCILKKWSKEVPVANGNKGSREGACFPGGHTCIAINLRLKIVLFHKKDSNGNRPRRPPCVILGRDRIMLP